MAILVIFVAAPFVLVSRKGADERYSRELILSVAQGDARAALTALERGADPNSNVTLLVETQPRSPWEQLLGLLRRRGFGRQPLDPVRAGTTAIVLAVEPDLILRLPDVSRFGRRQSSAV